FWNKISSFFHCGPLGCTLTRPFSRTVRSRAVANWVPTGRDRFAGSIGGLAIATVPRFWEALVCKSAGVLLAPPIEFSSCPGPPLIRTGHSRGGARPCASAFCEPTCNFHPVGASLVEG